MLRTSEWMKSVSLVKSKSSRNMMKKIGLILCVLISLEVNAQSDPFFSHYMFNPSYYNPGWMGDVNTAFASFQHRSQWVGYSSSFDDPGGAPSSQLLSFIVPTNGVLSSAGINVISDTQGPTSSIWIRAGAAYNFQIRQGIVSVGVMPGLVSRTLNFNYFRFEKPDPLDIGTRESQVKPDLAAGLFFNSFNGYFAGVGISHLLSSSFDFNISDGNGKSSQFKPTYYLHGGKRVQVNRDLEIKPILLVKTDWSGYSMDISGIATYKNIMWGGISYRRSEAAVLLVGYSFLPSQVLKVGYSFDYVVTDQDAKGPTSHEIFLKYDIPGFILGGRKEVKTPRFSF
ncbi:MAG: type IX secretion system membrane protein PorP/SprF [Cytophagales bacterium]|nr:type IX secretion system membrane protein PorP/SprF [Cytophagales bacterium]